MQSLHARLPVTAVAFADDRLLVAEGPSVHAFDVESGALLWTERVLSRERIHRLVWKACSLVAVGGNELAVLALAADERPCDLRLRRCADVLLDVALYCATGSGESILTVTAHNVVEMRDTASLALHRRIERDTPLLWSARFSEPLYTALPDVRVASGTIIRDLLLWRPFADEAELRLGSHKGSIFGTEFSPSRQCIASVTDERCVRIFDLRRPRPPLEVWGHQARIWRVAWVDDTTLVTCDEACEIGISIVTGDAASARLINRFRAHEGRDCWSIAVCAKRRLIASGGADSAVALWPLDGPSSAAAEYRVIRQVRSFGTSREADIAAAVTHDGGLHCIDIDTGASIQVRVPTSLLRAHATVFLRRDESRVLIVTKSGTLHRMSLRSVFDDAHARGIPLGSIAASAQLHQHGQSACSLAR